MSPIHLSVIVTITLLQTSILQVGGHGILNQTNSSTHSNTLDATLTGTPTQNATHSSTLMPQRTETPSATSNGTPMESTTHSSTLMPQRTETPSATHSSTLMPPRTETPSSTHTVSKSPTAPFVLVNRGPRRDAVIPLSVQDSIDTTSMSSTAVAAVFSPAAGLGLTKMNSVKALSECTFVHDEPLPRLISPTQLQFGAPHGAAYRGAVVGNIALFAGLAAAMYLIGCALALVRLNVGNKFTSFVDSFSCTTADMHLPSSLFVPAALCFQRTVASSISLFVHATDQQDAVYAFIGLALCLSFPGLVLFTTARSTNFHCELQERRPEPATNDSIVSRFFDFLNFSTSKWKNVYASDSRWKSRNYFFFGPFRLRTYVAVEFATAFAVGVVEGLRIANDTLCLALTFVPLACALLLLVLLLKFDAALIRSDKMFLVSLNTASLVIGAVTIGELILNTRSSVAGLLADVAFFLVTLKLLVDFLMLGWWASQHWPKIKAFVISGERIPTHRDELRELQVQYLDMFADNEKSDDLPPPPLQQQLPLSDDADVMAIAQDSESVEGGADEVSESKFDPYAYLPPGHNLDELDEDLEGELRRRREEWERRHNGTRNFGLHPFVAFTDGDLAKEGEDFFGDLLL